MEASQFDRLTKSLTEAGTRRRLLGALAMVPVLGGLAEVIDEAAAKHRSVTSDAARERHGARVLALGVPLGYKAVVESSIRVAYPVHLAIAQRRDSQRLIVIDAFERRVHERLCRSLSPHSGWIRDSLTR